MAIEVSCRNCGEVFRVEDESAGKSVKCKVCGANVRISEVEFEEDDSADEDLPQVRRRTYEDDEEERLKRRKKNPSSAAERTLGPAIGLYVTGGLWLLYMLFNVTVNFATADGPIFTPPQKLDPTIAAILFYGVLILLPLMTLVIVVGAFCLQMHRTYVMAMTACVLASIPCLSPGCILGMPFGIWGLVVLNQDDVKRSFQRRGKREPGDAIAGLWTDH